MRRRLFLSAALAVGAAPAWAQTSGGAASGVTLPGATQNPIEPVNALEYAFVSALTEPDMRPIFRRYLIDTHVVVAMTGEGADATPLEVQVNDTFRAVAIFTSAQRVDEVLGAETPRIVLNGRAALERVAGKNVVINYRLVPMLTLEPDDVARYLEPPGNGLAGPTQ
ncbi:MAG: SseB family protein [Hyphomonadaceae bacterium]|nr:SseB family protein [Hyphomonadaceae bacterium]